MKLFAFVLCIVSAPAFAAEWIPMVKGSESHDSIIKDVCLHDVATGTTRYTSLTSEDSGLVIRLRSSDGSVSLLYDATGEIEALAVLDTWAAPSANNIRILVQANGCYQLAPAANTFDVGNWVFLTIADSSSPAFMDYEARIVFLGTGADIAAAVVSGCTTFGCATEANVDSIALVAANILNCTVDTANFAGSTTTLACDLSDRDGTPITSGISGNDLTGRGIEITSGAQRYEFRFFNTTNWDGANNELRLTLTRALPATLADGVTAIIR